MQQRTFVITGASSGIGTSAARILRASRPQDTLVLVGRDAQRTAAIGEELGVRYHVADFASLGEVRRLAAELADLDKIDVLANNAGGIFDGPFMTADGYERTWQINVVAPFLLTALLQDKVRVAVQTASVAALLMSRFDPADPNTLRGFSAERAYGNAKLGDILLTRYLHNHGLNAVAFHPGVLHTNFSGSSTGRMNRLYEVGGRFMGGADVGGENLAYYITGTPGIHFESGEYYNDKRRKGLTRPIAKNDIVARRVFDEMGRNLKVSLPGR